MSATLTYGMVTAEELRAMIAEDGGGITATVTYALNPSVYSPATGKQSGAVTATDSVPAIIYDQMDRFDGPTTTTRAGGVAVISADELEFVPKKMISVSANSKNWWVTGMDPIMTGSGVIGYLLYIQAKR